MTEQHEGASFVEQIESDPRGRAELALAEAQLKLEELFERVINDSGALDYAGIAKTLGVPVDRVQRVFSGEDTLRFEAFVRYLSLLGRSVKIELVAKRDPYCSVVDHFEQVGASPAGVTSVHWHREAADPALEAIGPLRYTGTHEPSTGISYYDVARIRFSADAYQLGTDAVGRHSDRKARRVRSGI
ncbi:hypothetical protein [Curtobacterium sp. MCPF17_011]|uniref:hypothetical protein n=1 Tax=Curtobacterium sp. MCPF17_011 TaxID=2175652 RepID=UPI0011B5C9D1|nr:hypothetical protein [Curtobacterium sp. MCPF17_011]